MEMQEKKIRRAWIAIFAFAFLAANEVLICIKYSSLDYNVKAQTFKVLCAAIIFVAAAAILFIRKKKIFPAAIGILLVQYAVKTYLSITKFFFPMTAQSIFAGLTEFLFGASVLGILTVLGLYVSSEELGYERGTEKQALFSKIYRICFCVAMLSAVLMAVSSLILAKKCVIPSMYANKYNYEMVRLIEMRVGEINIHSADVGISIYKHGYLANLLRIHAIASLKHSRMPEPNRIGDEVYVASEYYVSLGKHICLLIFTGGIWQMIWTYKITKITNADDSESNRNPTSQLLLCLFVPFYIIYWTYKTALRIDRIAAERELQSDIGTVCLILSIFVPFVPPILMQDKMNQILLGNVTAPKQKESEAIESIEKYKALLDSGVITEEEFEAKKKQLLGL